MVADENRSGTCRGTVGDRGTRRIWRETGDVW